MKAEHVHDFSIKGERIKADNPDYNGTTGDKAFLLRNCECGVTRVFEYGEYQKMMSLCKELTK